MFPDEGQQRGEEHSGEGVEDEVRQHWRGVLDFVRVLVDVVLGWEDMGGHGTHWEQGHHQCGDKPVHIGHVLHKVSSELVHIVAGIVSLQLSEAVDGHLE